MLFPVEYRSEGRKERSSAIPAAPLYLSALFTCWQFDCVFGRRFDAVSKKLFPLAVFVDEPQRMLVGSTGEDGFVCVSFIREHRVPSVVVTS